MSNQTIHKERQGIKCSSHFAKDLQFFVKRFEEQFLASLSLFNIPGLALFDRPKLVHLVTTDLLMVFLNAEC